jgi:hypothetical protein
MNCLHKQVCALDKRNCNKKCVHFVPSKLLAVYEVALREIVHRES